MRIKLWKCWFSVCLQISGVRVQRQDVRQRVWDERGSLRNTDAHHAGRHGQLWRWVPSTFCNLTKEMWMTKWQAWLKAVEWNPGYFVFPWTKTCSRSIFCLIKYSLSTENAWMSDMATLAENSTNYMHHLRRTNENESMQDGLTCIKPSDNDDDALQIWWRSCVTGSRHWSTRSRDATTTAARDASAVRPAPTVTKSLMALSAAGKVRNTRTPTKDNATRLVFWHSWNTHVYTAKLVVLSLFPHLLYKLDWHRSDLFGQDYSTTDFWLSSGNRDTKLKLCLVRSVLEQLWAESRRPWSFSLLCSEPEFCLVTKPFLNCSLRRCGSFWFGITIVSSATVDPWASYVVLTNILSTKFTNLEPFHQESSVSKTTLA